MSALPTLVVVYGFGSAGPGEILRAAAGVCRPLIAFDGSAQPAEVRALLAELPDVVDVAGRTPEQTAESLAARCPQGMVTFAEAELGRTAELAELLGIPHHDRRTLRGLTDKWVQRETLAAAGVADVPHARIEAVEDVPAAVERVGLPAVLKPAVGGSSRNVRLVRTVAECRAVAAALLGGSEESLVLEEHLSGAASHWGDYVSVESSCHDDGPRHLAVTGKLPLVPPFREGGMFVPADLPEQVRSAVLALTTRVLVALGVRHGLTHTEIKLTDDGPRLLEVNGRLGGHVADLVRRAGGPCLVRAALLAALGRRTGEPRGWDRVAFQKFLLPPPRATRLFGVDGLATARAVPGVSRVEVTLGPGALPDCHQGAATRVGTVYGQVDDHARLRFVTDLLAETIHLRTDADTAGAGRWPR